MSSLSCAAIRAEFPGADEHEVRMRMGVGYYGAELMEKVYGWTGVS